jgi:ribose-phosphate pyrophosphokinase
MNDDPMMVFAGSGSTRLTERICQYLDILQGKNETLRFSDGNTFVRILENVRGRRVYIVQTTVFPSNDNFMELLFWIDAFKRAGSDSVTVVIPYFSYGKGDKKDEPRVSIRGRVCADALEVAGADRIVTMDLHAPQIQGFFHRPVDNLYALPVLSASIKAMNLQDIVVVSPDVGFAKQARRFAANLGVPIALRRLWPATTGSYELWSAGRLLQALRGSSTQRASARARKLHSGTCCSENL